MQIKTLKYKNSKSTIKKNRIIEIHLSHQSQKFTMRNCVRLVAITIYYVGGEYLW